jgi:hypothetical protein
MRTRTRMRILSLPLLLALLGGCGYALQGTRNELLEKEGIRRVFVAPLDNNTFKPGVENLVYNELIRTLAQHRRVTLVERAEDADAVLYGTVGTAGYAASGYTTADRLFNGSGPDPRASSSQYVASEYSAVLSASFRLERAHPPAGRPGRIWTSTFTRSKFFPASNQLNQYGTTNALINESEFDRALRDIARNMMGDVHESMLAMF